MKYLIVIAGLLLSGTGSLDAQGQFDAKALMDRVSEKLWSYRTLQADFSFTLHNAEEEINDTHEGSLILSGAKYRLKLMGITAICNGETLWTVYEELKEANILDPEENELFNPAGIFTLYEENFRQVPVSRSGDKAVIDLLPLEEDESYSRIRIEIIQSKEQICKVTYFSNDGNQYIIVIKKLSPGIEVVDRTFIFDPQEFPGIKVYDMRLPN